MSDDTLRAAQSFAQALLDSPTWQDEKAIPVPRHVLAALAASATDERDDTLRAALKERMRGTRCDPDEAELDRLAERVTAALAASATDEHRCDDPKACFTCTPMTAMEAGIDE